MNATAMLYTKKSSELSDFLSEYFSKKIYIPKRQTEWKNEFQNPIELVEFISTFIDNKNKYSNTNMLVTIDPGIFINIQEENYNSFIKYLFERFPY